MATIHLSVGEGAKNAISDVRVVQKLLNRYLPTAAQLGIDGRCGPKTKEAIRWFQKHIAGFRFPDGRVDPGGRTLHALNGPENAASRSAPLPSYVSGVARAIVLLPDILTAMQMLATAQAALIAELVRRQFSMDLVLDPQQAQREYRSIQQSFNDFQRIVEGRFPRVIELSRADAVVFSVSIAGGTRMIGGGGGKELVYSPRFGWAEFEQSGIGFVSRGVGVAFECGLVWNMERPSDYRGVFISVGGYVPGVAPSIRGLSGGAAFTPGDFLNLLNEGQLREACSWKLGVGFGQGASISALIQFYWERR
jgi:hypothetical protein